MSDKMTEHDITSLYKHGATEQPSVELDTTIMQNAAGATTDKVTSINKPKRIYQTWYGQLSTAASLVLVAVLYVQNTAQYPRQTETMKELQILSDEQSAPAPEVALEIMQSEAQQQVATKRMQKPQRNVQMSERQLGAQSMTAKSELLVELKVITEDVANQFKLIDTLIAEGNTAAAKAQLTDLLAAHPELKVHLTQQYKQLLQ